MSPTHAIPLTVLQALHLLAAREQQAATAEDAPATLGTSGEGLDLSRLEERGGIHQLGGRIRIGLNVTVVELARSSLVITQAACLHEACTVDPLAAGLPLGRAFPVFPPHADGLPAELRPLLVALAALDAELELAELGAGDRIERVLVPLAAPPAEAAASAVLPLSVSFPVGSGRIGSAFVPAPSAHAMSAAPVACAARLALSADVRTIAAAGVALLSPAGACLRVPPAEACLQGHPANAETIGAAGLAAQQLAMAQWPVTTPAAGYAIHLAAHLVRTALDRAIARALDTASHGAPF